MSQSAFAIALTVFFRDGENAMNTSLPEETRDPYEYYLSSAC